MENRLHNDGRLIRHTGRATKNGMAADRTNPQEQNMEKEKKKIEESNGQYTKQQVMGIQRQGLGFGNTFYGLKHAKIWPIFQQ
jgi:hypothetical protein